jgi:hypothetical protein
MLRYNLIIFSIILFISQETFSAETVEHPCEAKTIKLMNVKSTWKELYRAALKLPSNCFDGYYAEGISDTLVRKMGQDWSGFMSILVLHAKDQKFISLILDSINATLDPDDIRIVDKLAQDHCLAKLSIQCSNISKQAAAALQEF